MSAALQSTTKREPAALVDAVFAHGARSSLGPHRRVTIPVLTAIFVHLGLFLLALSSEPSLETWSAKAAARVHRNLRETAPISVEAPPSDEPAHSPLAGLPLAGLKSDSASKDAAGAEDAAPAPVAALRSKAPAPVQRAGTLPETEPAEPGGVPLDLTAAPMAESTATFARGAAAPTPGSGSARRAAGRQGQQGQGQQGRGSQGQASSSGATSVQLDSAEWHCPWPAEARDQPIFKQSVILKVTVSEQGKFLSAHAVRDPGFGFGKAAVACAKHARFLPARNRQGQPIRAESPPIRVRFVR